MKIPFLVIGGGLSGLAAAIRAARFIPDVLLVEQHTRLGGLNSYFYRNKNLFETGLHAITNYADPAEKAAPLNRLLRQLKFRRTDFSFCQQHESEIRFVNQELLRFSNDIALLSEEVATKFPRRIDAFSQLLECIKTYDAFAIRPFISAKSYLEELLNDSLLVDMLLCPLMYYGSSYPNDMDLGQFVIMFRAIFFEGMFRPSGTIKDFLATLTTHLDQYGATVRLQTKVDKLIIEDEKTVRVLLSSGEELRAEFVLSTIGLNETLALLNSPRPEVIAEDTSRLGFIETIYQIPSRQADKLPKDKTIIFYNCRKRFAYQVPETAFDPSSGVICFPGNFQHLPTREFFEIRSTHLANYSLWQNFHSNYPEYLMEKDKAATQSRKMIEDIVGSFGDDVIFVNTFTPITIRRYTGKQAGAIYGSPRKIKDGNIGYPNVFLAGTDQGFLGIVGAMLSGVSITNQHYLARL